ncbi:MAG: LamG domain-containing protein, partial [Rariglobus sp.]|nr:LamG domain-containing protein [Rariglobus sp.]
CALASLLIIASASRADTLAYYRFEDVTGDRIPSPPSRPTVRDSSDRKLDLYAYKNPALSTSVPTPLIPKTRAPNRLAVYATGTEDLYAKPDDGLSRVALIDFTIEVWAQFESIIGNQTLVGRDSLSRDQGAGALFYLSKTTHAKPGPGQLENAFRVELVTRSDRSLTIESNVQAQPGVWYHLAVVGNTTAGTVSLYVNGKIAGFATDFDGLFIPPSNPGWTIARGQYAGKATDHFLGWLDEVRFSDTALTPAQFLNSVAK